MELDHSEVVKILQNVKRGEKFKILDYGVNKNLNAVGYLGDYYNLSIKYCSDGAAQEVQLFIKSIPLLSAELQKEAIFQKEAWLYETLLSDMRKYSSVKWCPECYYTRSDIMVLENITLKGYKQSGSTELNDIHMNQLFKSMAAFHAASLVYEHRTGTNIGQDYGDHLLEITVASEIAWFTTGLAAVLGTIRSLPQYQGANDLEFIDTKLKWILEEIYEQAAPSKKYKNVLSHRDLWSGNIFFPIDETEPALLIDFQTCRYTPPAADLNFCLYLNLIPKDRRLKEEKFINLYYRYLQDNLVDMGLQNLLISKVELLESYEDFRLFGTVYRAVAATIVKVPAEFVTNEFKYVDRSEVILSYMKTNKEFRIYMEECCVDVMKVALTRNAREDK